MNRSARAIWSVTRKRGCTKFAAKIMLAGFCGLLAIHIVFMLTRVGGLSRAEQLYVPIACTGPNFGFKYLVGTGFPITQHLVITAKHVDCGPDAMTEISFDKGITWERIQIEDMFISPSEDVRVYRHKSRNSTKPVVFRNAIVGERVYSSGVAFGVISTTGYVIRIDMTEIISTNIAAGGMSGSALVAEDGKVVGMVTQAKATSVQYVPTAFVSSSIPGKSLQTAVKSLQSVGAPEQPPPVSQPHDAILLPRIP